MKKYEKIRENLILSSIVIPAKLVPDFDRGAGVCVPLFGGESSENDRKYWIPSQAGNDIIHRNDNI